MKNIIKNRFSIFLMLFLFGVMLTNTVTAFAQVVTITRNASGEVDIETKLHPNDPIDPTIAPDYETSVGFFYRLENTTTGKSYFWSSIINDNVNNEEITETLKLPDGTYTIIAYQSRKSKPIRSIKLSGTTGTFIISGSSYKFPEINFGGSHLKLFNSWNIYAHQFPPDSSKPEHFTEPSGTSEFLPGVAEPWVFMTLVKKDWVIGNPIKITFPDFLSFGGAIAGNYMHDGNLKRTKIEVSVDPVIPGFPQSVSLKNNVMTVSQQVIIHLIFKKNLAHVPDAYPLDATFGVSYSVDSLNEIQQIDTTFVFQTKPKPHDPNSLKVDKKELCECGFDEYLTYRIDYQNDGESPVDTALIILMDLNHLQTATIQHNNDTDGWQAPINYNLNFLPQKNEFMIKYLNGLPGLKQNSMPYPKVPAEACQDYFYIKVRKDDCLSAGTKIQPKAKIVFYGAVDTIYTNLDETLIVERSDCEPCKPHARCPNCPKKKPCWLFNWFRRKNKN